MSLLELPPNGNPRPNASSLPSGVHEAGVSRGPGVNAEATLEFNPCVRNTPIGPERSDRNARRESSGAQMGNMFCPSYVWRSVVPRTVSNTQMSLLTWYSLYAMRVPSF